MKRILTLTAALFVIFALLLPLAACGGKGDKEAVTTAAEEEPTEPVGIDLEDTTTAPLEEQSGEAETTAGVEGSSEAEALPGTPAEVLAAYTEVMNKAKKDAKRFRKLEYQFLDKNQMKFELDVINTPGFLDWLNDNLMTTKEKALTEDKYTQGVTDMTEDLPVMHTPLGCMVKDPGVFTKATARQLPGGNIELTLVMKPEDNPEPAQHGATTAPSRTGQMFNPLSKAGVDDLIYKARFLITTKLEFSLRYYDCKSVLVYNPETMQVVSLRQDYYVKINVANGKVLFINAKGSGVLEAATVCDQFKY
ncbi:MAG: hypothetical protein FWC27_14825 [Firmicutes bacterium]|nr:hypothetical protein [Bacillota bacterium]